MRTLGKGNDSFAWLSSKMTLMRGLVPKSCGMFLATLIAGNGESKMERQHGWRVALVMLCELVDVNVVPE